MEGVRWEGSVVFTQMTAFKSARWMVQRPGSYRSFLSCSGEVAVEYRHLLSLLAVLDFCVIFKTATDLEF